MNLDMKDMIGILILFFIFGVLIITYLKRRPPEGIWPYRPKKVLAEAGQILFQRLKSALPDSHVLAHVHLSHVLAVEKGKGIRAKDWKNRINRLSLNFVICNPDFSVLAVVELEDKTYYEKGHGDDDKRKNKALADAGIRLIRWKTEAIPDEATIRETLAGKTTVVEARKTA